MSPFRRFTFWTVDYGCSASGIRISAMTSVVRRMGATLFILAAGLCTVVSGASAATVPKHFIDRVAISGLTRPTAMAIAPDGHRIFVAEQGGTLRVISNGVLLKTPFVSLPVDSTSERGLLGVAFDPNFAVNHYVYVYYTATTPTIHNRVSRFTANGNVAVPGSEKVLLDLDDLIWSANHNGGAIHFGPDGKLYIATGDNGHPYNAQSLSTVLGKILRINPDGSIPADNPFYSQTSGKNKSIWAYGLRNPFTFAFNSSSGRMFINDVGAKTWEEVNDGIAGSNYGWPLTEGPTTDPRFRGPIYWYAHGTTNSTGCAITGGSFYAPARVQFPSSFVGDYFFSDYCSGWVRRLDLGNLSTSTLFATGIKYPVDLQVGQDGSLYYLARGAGAIGRISYLAAPKVTGFAPMSGSPGHWVRIDGGYLAGVTSVKFHGQPSDLVHVVSDVMLYARVPAGATSGRISVTTPAGTATSVSSFTVTG
jgi:glucose/arabinose dehydrogenase